MMRNSLFSLLFLGLILCACSSDVVDPPKNASEWVVIGNDLGFRNEFVDMANVVRLTDSNLTVYSVAYPDVELSFPIRDSTVFGSSDKRWRLTTAGPDSLLLHDTLQNNRYHLLRLKDYQPQDDVWKLLTSSRFAGHSYYDDRTFAFEGNDTTGANCYVAHRTRTWEGQRRLVRQKDGFWRLDERFSQPILLYTQGQGDHFVTLIDSVDSDYGFQGQLIINSRPNPQLNQRDTLRRIEETIKMVELRDKLTQLDFASAKVDPIIDPRTDERWRVSWNGSELEDGLSVYDFEVDDLSFSLWEDNYSIATAGKELVAGKFTLHPLFPYLILEGSCANDYYLPLVATESELAVTIPLRIRLADREVKQSGFGRDAPNRMAYSENAIVFTIPYFTQSSK